MTLYKNVLYKFILIAVEVEKRMVVQTTANFTSDKCQIKLNRS